MNSLYCSRPATHHYFGNPIHLLSPALAILSPYYFCYPPCVLLSIFCSGDFSFMRVEPSLYNFCHLILGKSRYSFFTLLVLSPYTYPFVHFLTYIKQLICAATHCCHIPSLYLYPVF